MDLGLGGKTAWVLGGSSGLGRGSAEALARERCDVAISARDETRLNEAAGAISAAGGARCVAVPTDVADAVSITAGAERVEAALGGIDILVANSAGPPPGSFDDNDDNSLFAAFDLVTASAWRLAKAVLPSMRSRGGGAIVFITSSSTKEVIDGLLLSNMMRAAVVGMAKTLSRELASDNVRVVCVAPGYHETPRVEVLERARAATRGVAPEEIRSESTASIPLGRFGSPADFGRAVAFLASPAAAHITGATVTIDGGACRTITA
ncbi:MAG TPA: SDR family oxidoreductase [Actinomycetota bacterium]|nr:SDR family oxidoreductase [Actinomycetota bacterium]